MDVEQVFLAYSAVLLATGDIDLLYDVWRHLRLAAELPPSGLLHLLRRVDKSFEASRGLFRATNRDGFMVDLVDPLPRNRSVQGGPVSIGNYEDPQAVKIEGLIWLVNSPKQGVVIIDERGFPVEMSVPDPRSFALHKAWLCARDDRDPIQRGRDMGRRASCTACNGAVATVIRQQQPDGFACQDAKRQP